MRDRSLALLRGGYDYLLHQRARDPDRPLQMRLLGRRTLVLAGAEGARLFYDPELMRRRGAIPMPLAAMLFGRTAVHGLDGAAHAHRKRMFLDLLTPDAARDIGAHATDAWQRVLRQRDADGARLSVFDAAVDLHTAVACAWAGVPQTDVPSWLPGDLMAMVDGFGSVGPRFAAGARARRRTGRWARDVVDRTRSGSLVVAGDSPLAVIAAHRDESGALLPVRTAAVELINLLRPTVAVAYFVAFSALALDDVELRHRMGSADDVEWESFAHELRRHYPFVPLLAARPRGRAEWNGVAIAPSDRIVLDVFGTLHDPQWWSEPHRFEPERFVGVDPDPYTYVPQGGGDPATGHRCPGERVAVELIKAGGRFLAELDYVLDPADRAVPLRRMPSRTTYGAQITVTEPRPLQ